MGMSNMIYTITEKDLVDRIDDTIENPLVDNAVLKLLFDMTGLSNDIS